MSLQTSLLGRPVSVQSRTLFPMVSRIVHIGSQVDGPDLTVQLDGWGNKTPRVALQDRMDLDDGLPASETRTSGAVVTGYTDEPTSRCS